MKRFHVHVAVEDLSKSIAFYSSLFGATPAVEKPDYAKWMLDDPRINFAVSQRGGRAGVDHLGIQVETDEELAAMRAQLATAEVPVSDEGLTGCCYAISDKHWVTDPQGVAWETYRTLDSIPTFHAQVKPDAAACCGTSTSETPTPAKTNAAACCSPAKDEAPAPLKTNAAACCGPAASEVRVALPVAGSKGCC
ncbi:MAG: ArsI/CadI family heavy metal resistance metalloenzyme [Betaproteobacteria bacterium]